MRPDVGIDAEADVSHFAHARRDVGYDFQLRDALHVEILDACFQGQLYLPIGLAYSGKDNLACGETAVQAGFNLTTAHAVGPKACLLYQPQHLRIGTGLDGIVQSVAFVPVSLSPDGGKRFPQQVSVVIVERCAQLFETLLHVLLECIVHKTIFTSDFLLT